jgi:hypothetical protein
MPVSHYFWEETFDLPAHFKYTSAVLDTTGSTVLSLKLKAGYHRAQQVPD